MLAHLGIHVAGEPVTADEGGIIKVASRDESETATIAALPWVSERKVRDFESLMQEGKHAEDYAEGVAAMLDHLAKSFQRDTVNILLTHLLIEDAKVGGPESGERELHMGQAYVVKRQGCRRPTRPGTHSQPQEAPATPVLALSSSDFGEAGQRNGSTLSMSHLAAAKVESSN
jgi:hypothetical protein